MRGSLWVTLVGVVLACLHLEASAPRLRFVVVGCAGCVAIFTTDVAQTVISGQPAGTSFLFKTGVHRHDSINPRAGDKYYAETNAILSGARALHLASDATLGSFATSGGFWRIGGQTQVGGARNGECQTIARSFPADYNGCDYPEELFFDGVRKLHVVTQGELAAGNWYFDYVNHFIYVGDNPTSHTVETSITATVFNPTANNVTLDGLTVEMYANQPQYGPINGEGTSGWIIQNSTLILNHGGAVRTGNTMRLSNNYVAYNGEIGLVGVGNNIIIENNELAHNNDAHYNQGWEGGGQKLVSTDGLIVRGNWSHHNHGPGLWTDIDNINVLYENNTSEDNDRMGIFHEISYAAIIRNNVTRRNGWEFPDWAFGGCIVVAASPNVEVYGNTAQDCADGITGAQQNRGSGVYGPHEMSNLYVHNNTIRMQTGSGWVGLLQDIGDTSYFTSRNNRFIDNTYQLQGSTNYFSWQNGDHQSFATWQGFGQDTAVSTSDTFTDTPTVTLGTHIGDFGARYTKVTGGGGGDWIITDVNRVRPGSAGTGHDTVATTNPPCTNEYDVEGDFVVFTHAGDFADTPRLMGRWLSSAQTGYMVYNTAGTWVLYKFEAGVGTGYLGDFVQALVDGTTTHVKLEIRSAAKKVFIAGTQRISSADDALTAVGYGGLGTGFYNSAATNTTGTHVDNFKVTTLCTGTATVY